MRPIASLKNQRVKDAARLRERRARDEQARCIIDGVREIGRALAAGIEPLEVFVCEAMCESAECRQLLARLKTTQADFFSVTPAVLEKLAFGERSDGVVAVAVTPQRTLDDLQLPADPLIVVLEGVEKPGNIGAVMRTADGAGASALIVADGGTDLFNPNAIRASLGTIFSLPVCAVASDAVRRWLGERKIPVFAARVKGALPYTQADLSRSAAIVLGSEAEGLTSAWSGADFTAIRLPMQGAADSLNVSAAAAVLLYEARRQRDAARAP